MTDLAALVGRTITERTGIELPPDVSFFVGGLTSSDVIAVHASLQRVLGRRFPVAVFFEHPTCRDLAAHLAHEGEQTQEVQVDEVSGWTPRSRRDLRAQLRQWRG